MRIAKKNITCFAGFFTISTASLVLIGWIGNIDFLKSILPGSISMKVNTAVCFLLLGIALVLHYYHKGRYLILGIAILVILTGLVTLSEYFIGKNLGIDELLWKEGKGTVDTLFPGRISAPAALHFLLIGVILIIMPYPRMHMFIYFALLVVVLISGLAFLSFIFGISYLNSLPLLTKLALPTTIAFLILCLGIYYSNTLKPLRLSFQKKLTAAFLLIILILAIIFYIYGKNNEQFFNTAQWVENTNAVLYQSERVQSALTDIETGVRGYLLTDNIRFLEPFYKGKKDIQLFVEKLKKLTLDNAGQQIRIDSLISLIDKKISQSDLLVANLQVKKYVLGQSVALLAEDKKTMDMLRSRVLDIQNEEKKMLANKKLENEVSIANTGRIIYFFAFVMVIILFGMLRIIHTNFNARQKAECQLMTANKELESFSYSVSHDLRAPLRGIDGWSLALLEDYGEMLDEKAHQYLNRVRTETQRMGELIDDMIKLAQVTRMELKPAVVKLSELADRICKRQEELYPERCFMFSIQPDLQVYADARLLEIVLTNLLGNACKFTAKVPVAKIEFGKKNTNNSEAYYIKDNGAGFNMESAKKLFGAFQRMHKQSDFPGTGIGLATVAKIVQLYKGKVWAEASINEGATFYFTIDK